MGPGNYPGEWGWEVKTRLLGGEEPMGRALVEEGRGDHTGGLRNSRAVCPHVDGAGRLWGSDQVRAFIHSLNQHSSGT